MKNNISFSSKSGHNSNKHTKINQKDKLIFNSNDGSILKNDINNYFCCPKCKEKILISLNPLNFSLSYNCQNNHKEINLDYNIFYSKRYIKNNYNKFCQQCNKEILDKNKIINCTICNMKLCEICILKHKNLNIHNNLGLISTSSRKCSKHDIDKSLFCKTCQQNLCTFCIKNEKNEHFNHDIINIYDLIPDENEIKSNELKLKEKIKKNKLLIAKLKTWKEEMISLIDDIIYKLKNEKLIYQMIIENFNLKYLDYYNYMNYDMAIKNLKIKNQGLENFYNSKMFIEQTNTINEFLFGKNYKKNNNENLNIKNQVDNNEIIAEKSIISCLKSGNALLFNNNIFYSYSLKNKYFFKIYENINDEKEKNHNYINKSNEYILGSMNNLKINLSKLGNYNILIWKTEEELKNDNLINLIKNSENQSIHKFKIIQISNKFNLNIIKNINNNFKNNLSINRQNYFHIENCKNNSLFNNLNINNASTNIFTNFNSNENIYEEEEEEEEEENERENEYVYISRTGSKYHGSSQCGRMRSSTMVSLREAESLGLEPCMKCY